MRVLSCVGARPQFIKAAVLARAFERRNIEEILVHTGQHYDAAMSSVFFDELKLRSPKYELGVGSANHGAQTGEMLKRLEPVIESESPDYVLVYGDTNSTLAAALAAVKLNVRVAHVEAGLRSFNRAMPEEINRVLVDHVSEVLFAPTENAANRLAAEGISSEVYVVGDVMVDLALEAASLVPATPPILGRLGLRPKGYGVVTVHRASNTDDAAVFRRLIDGLRQVDMPIVFPVHPRTRGVAAGYGVGAGDNIIVTEPISYLEMIALMKFSAIVFTDSGGIQKEAFVLKVPCVTMRKETEWMETVDQGWNVLVGTDAHSIAQAARRPSPLERGTPYGDGRAAERIAAILAGGAPSTTDIDYQSVHAERSV